MATKRQLTTLRWAIYVRISQDRSGEALGVQRQEQDCRALVARIGGVVVNVYIENDVSAYNTKRPQWDRLRCDVESGAVNAIAAWDMTRLTKSMREIEDIIDFADARGLQLATYSGEIDLATPTGRMLARIMGATARQESEQKGLRHCRQIEQAAKSGRPHGGPRGFGYEIDRVTIIPSEAEIIRELKVRCLAGESLNSMARDMNARGITTATGGKWSTKTILQVLISARISGRREHTPKSTRTQTALGEIVAVDCWPAIITVDESDRLRALLTSPGRRLGKPFTGRKYLLSSILRCGKCGNGLIGALKEGGYPVYRCSRSAQAGCGRISIAMRMTDDALRDMALYQITQSDVLGRLNKADDVAPGLPAAIADDEAKLAEGAAMFADGEIGRMEWRVVRERIEPRLEANRALLARASAKVPLALWTGTYEQLQTKWVDADMVQRRAIVGALIDKVIVASASARGARFTTDRLQVTWRA